MLVVERKSEEALALGVFVRDRDSFIFSSSLEAVRRHSQARQALLNVLKSALEAMPAGGTSTIRLAAVERSLPTMVVK